MIDFELRPDIKTSETQRMVYEAARDFALNLLSQSMEWDEAQYFPLKFLIKQGRLGSWECSYQKVMVVQVWVIMSMSH